VLRLVPGEAGRVLGVAPAHLQVVLDLVIGAAGVLRLVLAGVIIRWLIGIVGDVLGCVGFARERLTQPVVLGGGVDPAIFLRGLDACESVFYALAAVDDDCHHQ